MYDKFWRDLGIQFSCGNGVVWVDLTWNCDIAVWFLSRVRQHFPPLKPKKLMTPKIPTPLARSGGLLAAMLLSAVPVCGQSFVNPSFETDTFTNFPGYVSGNSQITGWTVSLPDRAGLNPAGSSPFADNGAIPHGAKVGFIQAGGASTSFMTTEISGLTVGVRYNVSFRINARWGNSPHLRMSIEGGSDPAVAGEVIPVGGPNPYRHAAYEFTATEETHILKIENIRTDGDHTLLVDDFKIAESLGEWSIAPWTGDEDSGIDAQYVYTHAHNFGSNATVTINGVPFIGQEVNVTGRFSITDLNNGTGRDPNLVNISGDSKALAQNFRFNGANTGVTLRNLKPSTTYVFTVYGFGWDAADSTTPFRASTFSSTASSQRLTVNLNEYGLNHGMRVQHTYTTDELGSDVSISYPATGTGSFHTSGFSNREAAPRVEPEAWAALPWDDDSTSGVSGSHHYTHAFNLGSSASVNINGIQFTGLPDANPLATGYTLSSPSLFPSDVGNTVVGASAVLARSFLYGAFPANHHLTGLVPGKEYVFTFYSTTWDPPGTRVLAMSGAAGEGRTLIDQNEFGGRNGIRVEYRYKADANGQVRITASAISLPNDSNRSSHIYAISNREADPLVDVAPSITLQPVGGSEIVGRKFSMRVGVIGSETLNYVWKRGSTTVGGNSMFLDFDALALEDTGVYTVTISNGSGEVTSVPVTLTVVDPAPGLFSTGVGIDGSLLPAGTVDPHFSIIVNPDNPESSLAYVQSGQPGAWLANSSTSQWIGPRQNTVAAAGAPDDAGAGPGIYVYRTRVDLTGFDLSTARITGDLASDNLTVSIRVNGVEITGFSPPTASFSGYYSFLINQASAPGLIAGVNTIDFHVRNDTVGYAGLRLDQFRAGGVIPPNTPPHLAVQPASVVGQHFGVAIFSVGASGSAPLSYQWFDKNGMIDGEIEPVLLRSIDDLSPAGDYWVVVSNGVGEPVRSETAVLTVGNQDPVAVADQFETGKNQPLFLDVLFDLLDNDTDADGDTLELVSVSAASEQGGTVVEEFGLITYTPPVGFVGEDRFTYTISDGIWGGTAQGTVTISVTSAASGPPTDLVIVFSNGTVTGSFMGTPGDSYTIQRSTTLQTNDWVDLATVVAPASGLVELTDPEPPVGRAFYRISYPE